MIQENSKRAAALKRGGRTNFNFFRKIKFVRKESKRRNLKALKDERRIR